MAIVSGAGVGGSTTKKEATDRIAKAMSTNYSNTNNMGTAQTRAQQLATATAYNNAKPTTATTTSTYTGSNPNSLSSKAKEAGTGLLGYVKNNNVLPSNTSNVSGNTGSSGSSINYGNYSYSGGSSDDILDQIKSLLTQQQEASKNYYNTLYSQRMNEINAEANRNRDLINANYKRGERYLNNLYGRTDSGNNWTNRARNNQNWLSQLATNRENVSSLRDSAAAQRDLGLANAASTMAQGWYNYVLPIMSNRQQTLDDYDYRRYLASL